MTAIHDITKQIISELNENAMDFAIGIKAIILIHENEPSREYDLFMEMKNAAVKNVMKNPDLAATIIENIYQGVKNMNYNYELIQRDSAAEGVHLPNWDDIVIA